MSIKSNITNPLLSTVIKSTVPVNNSKHPFHYHAIRKQGTHLYLSDLSLAGDCSYSTFTDALQFTSYKTALAFNQIAEGQIVECNTISSHPIIKSV